MKRTTLSDTLVVSIGAVADNWFHFQCDTLCYLEIFGSRLKGQVGVALAAAGTAHFPDFQQRPGRHQVALSPGFLSERGGTGEDGHAHTGTDGSPAASPKPTGTTRHLASACHHFLQGRQQLDFTSSSPVPLFVCIWGLLHSRCHVAISDNLHRWSLSGSFDHTDTAPWYSKPGHFPSNG